VFRHRFLIISLACLFAWAALLNAVGHCFLAHDHPTKSYGQIPTSISCPGNQEHSYLAQIDRRDRKLNFSKADKPPAGLHSKALLPEQSFHFARTRPAGSILVSLSLPIYQFNNVYRI
jgi:hypothetical protein